MVLNVVHRAVESLDDALRVGLAGVGRRRHLSQAIAVILHTGAGGLACDKLKFLPRDLPTHVPKRKRVKACRISLTFRDIVPQSRTT